MPRSFKVPQVSLSDVSWSDPQVLVRLGLGVLLIANLVAAGFAFNIFGASPEALDQQLISARTALVAAQQQVKRSRVLAVKVDKGKGEGDTFLAGYITDRRHTYSTIIGELTDAAATAKIAMGNTAIAPLDPIEGSDDLDMMTISVDLEGNFSQLVKFVNLLDRSQRFLIIESMTASPQPKGDLVTVNLKLNTFVREQPAGAL